jgi:parallel beta-helix repeat protein
MLLAGLWAPAAPAQSPDRLPPEIADKLPPGTAERLAESRTAANAAAADARRAAEAQKNVEGPPRTLFVDKDRVQCPHAEFQSIQEAVAAAPPGSTVMVCPDLYTEEVTVDKPLRLMKHGRGNGEIDERPRCFEPEPPDPTRDAIVEGTISLFSQRIVLDGFVVQGSFFGIYASRGDTEIRDNLVQENELGLFTTFSRGLRAHDNCFRQNALGVGLDSSDSAEIEHNAFFQNSDGGAALIAGGDVRFEHNISRGDEYFFVAAVFLGSGEFGTTGGPGRISYNESRGSGSEAAVITFGNFGLRITHNRLREALVGIDFVGQDFGDEVAHNDVRDMRRDGIRANFFGIFGSQVAFNRLTDNGQDGLNLQEGNSDNRVEHNDARRNGSDGIHAEGAEGNVFRTNVMFDNVEFDARDDKRTANRWIRNQCRTDFPTGTICGVSDPAP